MARAKQGDLPGMEDRSIPELVDKAKQYVDVRNDRQDLTRRESELKQDLLGLMHRHKKTEYIHDGVEIKIVVEEETIKVKLVKDEPTKPKKSKKAKSVGA